MFHDDKQESPEQLAKAINDLTVERDTTKDLENAFRTGNARSLAAELKNAERSHVLVQSLMSHLKSEDGTMWLHIAYAEDQREDPSIGHISLMLTRNGFAINIYEQTRPPLYKLIDFAQLPLRLYRYGLDATTQDLIRPDKHNLQYFNITFNEVIMKLSEHAVSKTSRKINFPTAT